MILQCVLSSVLLQMYSCSEFLEGVVLGMTLFLQYVLAKYVSVMFVQYVLSGTLMQVC